MNWTKLSGVASATMVAALIPAPALAGAILIVGPALPGHVVAPWVRLYDRNDQGRKLARRAKRPISTNAEDHRAQHTPGHRHLDAFNAVHLEWLRWRACVRLPCWEWRHAFGISDDHGRHDLRTTACLCAEPIGLQ
jgi:hypothetical protein